MRQVTPEAKLRLDCHHGCALRSVGANGQDICDTRHPLKACPALSVSAKGTRRGSYLVYLRVVGPRLQGPRWLVSAVLVDPVQVLLQYTKLLMAPVPSIAPVVCCNTGATRVSCAPDHAVILYQADAPINEVCER